MGRRFYRFSCGLVRLLSRRMRTEWEVPYEEGPCVFVVNNTGLTGPVDMVTKFEKRDKCHPWINDALMDRKKIAASLSTAYREVLSAQLALSQAQAKAALEEQNLAAAGSRLAAGTITQTDYDARVRAAEDARTAVQSADLALFSAMETYDWSVNGLAAAE